jgi:hypothetical chaperone protein
MLPLDRFAPGEQKELTRIELELASETLVKKVEITVSQILRDASLPAGGIDTVFFTGGSSGIPLLRQRIAALLPQARVVEGDLFGSIGAGWRLMRLGAMDRWREQSAKQNLFFNGK